MVQKITSVSFPNCSTGKESQSSLTEGNNNKKKKKKAPPRTKLSITIAFVDYPFLLTVLCSDPRLSPFLPSHGRLSFGLCPSPGGSLRVLANCRKPLPEAEPVFCWNWRPFRVSMRLRRSRYKSSSANASAQKSVDSQTRFRPRTPGKPWC